MCSNLQLFSALLPDDSVTRTNHGNCQQVSTWRETYLWMNDCSNKAETSIFAQWRFWDLWQQICRADKMLKFYLPDFYAGACVQVAAVWQEWSVSWASAAWAACWDHLGYLLNCCLAPVSPLREVQQVVWNKFSQGVPPNPLASCFWWPI